MQYPSEGKEGRPLVVLLVGAPGSGKTTFCNDVMSAAQRHWTRICQDIIANGKAGTKSQCLQSANIALKDGKNVLIDRCNLELEQRSEFVKLGGAQVDVHAVVLDLPARVCISRSVKRSGHEGNLQGGKAAAVVNRMLQKRVPPKLNEGFSRITFCHDENNVKNAVDVYSSLGPCDNLPAGIFGQKSTDAKVQQGIMKFLKKVDTDGNGSQNSVVNHESMRNNPGVVDIPNIIDVGKDKRGDDLLQNAHASDFQWDDAPTLAFPSISTSDFQFNQEKASDVIVETVADFVRKVDNVRLILVDLSPKSKMLSLVKGKASKAKVDTSRFSTHTGDITRLHTEGGLHCNVIANAANWRLKPGGGGVNAAIFSAGGEALEISTKEQAETISPGTSVLVPVPKTSVLYQREGVTYVIHVLGPNMNPQRPNCLKDDYVKGCKILRDAYTSLFENFASLTRSQKYQKELSGDFNSGPSESIMVEQKTKREGHHDSHSNKRCAEDNIVWAASKRSAEGDLISQPGTSGGEGQYDGYDYGDHDDFQSTPGSARADASTTDTVCRHIPDTSDPPTSEVPRSSDPAEDQVMNEIFRPLLCHSVLIFFDDILFYNTGWEEHLTHVERVFSILRQHQLYAKQSKCSFGQEEVEYLGLLVSADGVKADPKKIESMLSWPHPQTVRALRGFLGLTGYYRRFVKDYSKISSPLTLLLQKDAFVWKAEAEAAFQSLKGAMTSTPVLALSDFTKEFVLETDASDVGIVAVLMQEGRPLAFYTKSKDDLENLTKIEQRNERTNHPTKSSWGSWAHALHKVAMHPEDYKDDVIEMSDDYVVIIDLYPKAKKHILVTSRLPGVDSLSDIRRENLPILKKMHDVGLKWAEKFCSHDPSLVFRLGYHSEALSHRKWHVAMLVEICALEKFVHVIRPVFLMGRQFLGAPSMRQLHLHVISQDFDSSHLRNKKHWNSFNTKFFRDSIDAMIEIEKIGSATIEYEKLLSSELRCHRCKSAHPNISRLKSHIATCKSPFPSYLQNGQLVFASSVSADSVGVKQ
ncbi:Transcription factor bHLH140 [Platanthera zijinensis]|uniref:Transcription factor bHLH140 n=1 Tax=Platanthera zijinensis TaxID=2320716 RepID=A0AAP0B4Z8_9ASPA